MSTAMERVARRTGLPTKASEHPRSAPFVLWFSAPMALLAVAGSLAGILVDTIYSTETENWAAQAVAQDIVNLLAFSTLVILAIVAARGSLRAYLAWLGVVAYSVYTFAIYTFALHFGPLFLGHVAVFGLSIYALVVGLMRIDYGHVKETFTGRVPRRFIAALLVTIGVAFYLLWLSSVVGSTLTGRTPVDVVKAGLLTNPVHVLDMAVFLPAMLLAGVLTWRRCPLGYVLTPLVLGAAFTISLGIVVMQPILAVRGETPAWGIGGAIAIVAVVELVALIQFLRGVNPEALLSSVQREAGT